MGVCDHSFTDSGTRHAIQGTWQYYHAAVVGHRYAKSKCNQPTNRRHHYAYSFHGRFTMGSGRVESMLDTCFSFYLLRLSIENLPAHWNQSNRLPENNYRPFDFKRYHVSVRDLHQSISARFIGRYIALNPIGCSRHRHLFIRYATFFP